MIGLNLHISFNLVDGDLPLTLAIVDMKIGTLALKVVAVSRVLSGLLLCAANLQGTIESIIGSAVTSSRPN